MNKKYIGIIITIMAIFLISISMNTVSSTDKTINNTTSGGLNGFIGNANTNDKIILNDGVYSGTNNRGITINKNLTIIGKNNGKAIIDAQNQNRIFTINKGVKVEIVNITFRNGNYVGDSTFGGAIYNNGGKLSVNGCTFINNRVSGSGGAIYNEGGTLNIEYSNFNSNRADGLGGAIFNSVSGTLRVNASMFTSNTANFGGAIQGDGRVIDCIFKNNKAMQDGGAICSFGNGELYVASYRMIHFDNIEEYVEYYSRPYNGEISLFSDNQAKNGGAIYKTNGILKVYYTEFTNNRASTDGGAIYNYKGILNIFSSDISPSSFTNNRANRDGGAIYNYGGTLNIDYFCFFIKNQAKYGGAISNIFGKVNVKYSDFENNQAKYGGGIYNYDGKLNVNSCDFTKNRATYYGGAIYDSGKDFKVTNSKFLKNIQGKIYRSIYSYNYYIKKNNAFNPKELFIDLKIKNKAFIKGKTAKITHTITNFGHNKGKFKLTFKLAKGFTYKKPKVSAGKISYNKKTKTLTWTITNLKVHKTKSATLTWKLKGKKGKYVMTPKLAKNKNVELLSNNKLTVRIK